MLYLTLSQIDVSPDGTRCNVGVSAIMRVTLRDGTFHEVRARNR
jgi:recombination DNA repair RAD52 pathway protein